MCIYLTSVLGQISVNSSYMLYIYLFIFVFLDLRILFDICLSLSRKLMVTFRFVFMICVTDVQVDWKNEIIDPVSQVFEANLAI